MCTIDGCPKTELKACAVAKRFWTGSSSKQLRPCFSGRAVGDRFRDRYEVVAPGRNNTWRKCTNLVVKDAEHLCRHAEVLCFSLALTIQSSDMKFRPSIILNSDIPISLLQGGILSGDEKFVIAWRKVWRVTLRLNFPQLFYLKALMG